MSMNELLWASILVTVFFVLLEVAVISSMLDFFSVFHGGKAGPKRPGPPDAGGIRMNAILCVVLLVALFSFLWQL